jgi:hypothetical protein
MTSEEEELLPPSSVSTSTSRPHPSRHKSPQQPPLQHQLLFQTIRLTSRSCFHLQGRSSSTNFTHPTLLHIAVPAPVLYLCTSPQYHHIPDDHHVILFPIKTASSTTNCDMWQYWQLIRTALTLMTPEDPQLLG